MVNVPIIAWMGTCSWTCSIVSFKKMEPHQWAFPSPVGWHTQSSISTSPLIFSPIRFGYRFEDETWWRTRDLTLVTWKNLSKTSLWREGRDLWHLPWACQYLTTPLKKRSAASSALQSLSLPKRSYVEKISTMTKYFCILLTWKNSRWIQRWRSPTVRLV